MSGNEDSLRTLREALRLSPENVPLRQHLAEMLLSIGHPAEAEKEYRLAISRAPDNLELKLGLARAFHQSGKNSAALVLVEEILRNPQVPSGAAHLLYARLLLKAGDAEKAVKSYLRAVEADASLADVVLAEQLGVPAKPMETRQDPDEPAQEWTPQEQGQPEDRRLRAGGEGDPDLGTQLERPRINFASVGGMEKLKEEIRLKIIHPLTHPEIYRAYGKSVGGGILMYGPPGCGKTHLARATAGEVKAGFISVGIHQVLDMWLGNSEQNLHKIFNQARQHAPCVLFFDEVDALGASRTDMRVSAGRHLINQFLAELDGVDDSNEGVLILAATNAPWHLDSAFRRPGRFDRVLFVPPPDAVAREAILRILLTGKPARDVDCEYLAKKSQHFSGADMEAIVDLAIEAKLAEAMKKGLPSPLTTADLSDALKKHRSTTREWFATARNYAVYSNEGGIYDDILAYLKLL